MGNVNCCKRHDEGDIVSNINFEDSRPIIENPCTHSDNNIPQLNNNDNDNKQCNIFPPDTISQNLYTSSLTSTNDNIKYFGRTTEVHDVQTVTQQDTPFTNVNNDNNMPFKVNDEISNTIFDLLNNIRTHPSNYIKETKQYSVSYLLTQASERSELPPLISKDTLYYNKVKEILLSYNTSPKTDEDFEIEINQIDVFQQYTISIYVKHVPLNKPNESIWKLFQSRNAYENIIINNKINYCIVCAVPIEEDDEMKVVFVMLESKI